MSQYFPKSYKSFEGNISVKVDLSNHATKANIKISHMLILQVCSKIKFSQFKN